MQVNFHMSTIVNPCDTTVEIKPLLGETQNYLCHTLKLEQRREGTVCVFGTQEQLLNIADQIYAALRPTAPAPAPAPLETVSNGGAGGVGKLAVRPYGVLADVHDENNRRWVLAVIHNAKPVIVIAWDNTPVKFIETEHLVMHSDIGFPDIKTTTSTSILGRQLFPGTALAYGWLKGIEDYMRKAGQDFVPVVTAMEQAIKHYDQQSMELHHNKMAAGQFISEEA